MAVSLLDEYPHSEAFQLRRNADGSGGEIVMLPVHQKKLDYLYLAGSAQIEKLNEALAGQGLRAVPPTPEEAGGLTFDRGSGIVGIYFLRVADGDVGPYQEVMMTIKVEQRVEGVVPKTGWFVWDIKLTSDLALRFGREYWGYEKSLADVNCQFRNGDSTFDLSIPDSSGAMQRQIEGRMDGNGLTQMGRTTIPAIAATPYALRRSWQGSLTRAMVAFKTFDEATDYLAIYPETPFGQKLVAVGFEPRFWMTAREGQVIGFKGDEEVRQIMAGAAEEAKTAANPKKPRASKPSKSQSS
jgi:hypothetical protein